MTALVAFKETLSAKLARQFNRGKRDDLQWQAEKQYALAIIQKNSYLQKATPESFGMAMLDVAWSGLSLNPVTAHGYLIPYRDTERNVVEITFKPSYRGLEHLVYRAGTVKSIQTVLVHRGDVFRVETRNNRRVVTHEELGRSTDVTHAYCIVHYANGGEYVEVMTAEQLAAVERAAKSRPGGGAVWNGPWKGEMQRKAVLRRALKHAPLDTGGAIEHAIAVADKLDPVSFEHAPVEREAVEELIGDEQANRAHAFLAERDVKDPDHWLMMLAQAMGFERFENLPTSHFDEAMKRLEARYNAWAAKREQS